MPSRTDVTVQLLTSMPAAGPVPPASLSAAAAGAKPLLHTVSHLHQQPRPTLSVKPSPLRPYISQPPRQSVADDGRRTIAKVPPPDSDSEDEVEVIQAFYGRPTRSGRIPRPAVRPSEDDIEQFTGITEPLKSFASISSSSSQINLAVSSSMANVGKLAINQPEHVETLSQSQVRHTTSLPQSSAVSIQPTSENPVAGSVSAIASSMPPLDVSHLPPGYFVVVEVPSASGSSDTSGGQQQALYHIFAVDEGIAESSTLPAVNVGPQSVTQSLTLPAVNVGPQSVTQSLTLPAVNVGPQSVTQSLTLPAINVSPQFVTESSTLPAMNIGPQQPYISTAVCRQPQMFNSTNIIQQTMVCNQPVTVSRAGDASNSSNVQFTSESVMRSESLHTATSTVPLHTGTSLLTQEQASSTLDVTQICEDLSDLANCELTAMKQEDGTVVIQTTPLTNRLPPPRPQPPAVMVPRPALQLVPRQMSMKLVPRFPPSPHFVTQRPHAQMVTHGQPYSTDIVLDTDCGISSDMMAEGEDGTQYVDIVVEDCDNFEREEYVV